MSGKPITSDHCALRTFPLVPMTIGAIALIVGANFCRKDGVDQLEGVAVGQDQQIYAIIDNRSRRYQQIIRLSPTLSDAVVVWQREYRSRSYLSIPELLRRHVKDTVTRHDPGVTWNPATVWSVAEIRRIDSETGRQHHYRVSPLSWMAGSLLMTVVCVGFPFWIDHFLKRDAESLGWRQTAVDVSIILLLLTMLGVKDHASLHGNVEQIATMFDGDSSSLTLILIWVSAAAPVGFVIMLAASRRWVRWIGVMICAALPPMIPIVILASLFRLHGYRIGDLPAIGDHSPAQSSAKTSYRWQISISDALAMTFAFALLAALGIHTLDGFLIGFLAVFVVVPAVLVSRTREISRIVLLASSGSVTMSAVTLNPYGQWLVVPVGVSAMVISAVAVRNFRISEARNGLFDDGAITSVAPTNLIDR